MPPLIRLRGLRKTYGPRRALDGIDLTLDRHELVGVVGPDGAGKTTLLRTLAGLLEIEAQEAMALGTDLRHDVTHYKSDVGYVPQAFSLQRDLSILENLRFTARLHRLPADVAAARAGELLERTGLARFASRAAGALSGGMKQKLAIANAMLLRPALLLLDEPTAGVDVVARAEIWEMLAEARPSTLILVSTSYLEEALACDRLLYLDAGRLLANGTPRELQDAVPVELYRAWGDDPRRIAGAARELAFVTTARAAGPYARIEIARRQSPGEAGVFAALHELPGGPRLVEAAPIDIEAMLLSLARNGVSGG